VKKFYFYILGIVTGFANGLFGSGGGIIAVPMLEHAKLEQKKAHATSISLTLPLSIISAVIYGSKSSIDWSYMLPLIPAGLLGAVAGSIYLKRISNILLRRIFGGILIISGLRMLFL
jgi:uncharacterized membrane protein YfcA